MTRGLVICQASRLEFDKERNTDDNDIFPITIHASVKEKKRETEQTSGSHVRNRNLRGKYYV